MQQHHWSSTFQKEYVAAQFISLHWLQVTACIKFKTLRLVYKTMAETAPPYFNVLIQLYNPSRPPCSADERHLNQPLLQGPKTE